MQLQKKKQKLQKMIKKNDMSADRYVIFRPEMANFVNTGIEARM